MHIKEQLQTFLQENEIMALATTDGFGVDVCNLHYYADEDGNLYFVSRPQRKHAKNIEKNPEVSVCIYAPDESGDIVVSGIQVKGVCHLFELKDGQEQMKAFYDKFSEKQQGEAIEAAENYDFRSFYKITPQWIRVIHGRSWDVPHEITL